jgi:hypothetical protein
MLTREVIEDLVVLLRGFFSTPMISSLGRLEVLEAMRMATSFTVEDFHNIPNKKLLRDTFRYFVRIGLIEDVDGQGITYRTSELGKEIFRRANSFYVPHSYFEYMYHYHDLIQQSAPGVVCEVERLENVIGSGITHLRYFPPAVSFLKRKVDFDVLIDVGCGDGQFLSTFMKDVPGKKVIGIDLSKLSTETTVNNLRQQYPGLEVSTICSDALDVKYWSNEVLRVSGKGRVAISMWFLLHEISKGRVEILVEFFRQIHQVFPDAPIVVGEVVRQSEDILFKNSAKSLMSEYLLFHEMSGQGILSWPEYKEVLKNISYELSVERLFDEALSDSGENIPSTFVWCLMPK